MEIQNSYKVGDKTFTNLKEAQKYIIEIMYNNGLDWILENPVKFSETILEYKDIKPVKKASTNPNGTKTYSNVGKGNLEGIKEKLKNSFTVERDSFEWPVYHFNGINGNQSFTIRFTGKVHELHDLVVNNPENFIKLLKSYRR